MIDNDCIDVKIDTRDGHTHVSVGAWSLTVWPESGDEQPRIQDLEAARRLGFKRPRKIREIIERIWPRNAGLYVRPTVGRQPVGPRGGGSREYTVNEIWLTEAQLLKLCARSETDIAEAILDDMIRVYMLARRGLTRPAPAPQIPAEILSLLGELRHELTETRREYGQLVRLVAASSKHRGDALRAKITTASGDYARISKKSVRSWRLVVENKIRDAVGYPRGKGRGFDTLPLDLWQRALIVAESEADCAARLVDTARQGNLKLVAS